MGVRYLASASTAATLVAIVAAWQLPAAGQQAPSARPAPRPAASTAAARTVDGHPDLQGVYDVATLTPLERPAMFGTQMTMTDQQARQLEQAVAARTERAALPDRGDRAAPPIGGDGSTGAAGNV